MSENTLLNRMKDFDVLCTSLSSLVRYKTCHGGVSWWVGGWPTILVVVFFFLVCMLMCLCLSGLYKLDTPTMVSLKSKLTTIISHYTKIHTNESCLFLLELNK
jgi:hypothetical protein